MHKFRTLGEVLLDGLQKYFCLSTPTSIQRECDIIIKWACVFYNDLMSIILANRKQFNVFFLKDGVIDRDCPGQ